MKLDTCLIRTDGGTQPRAGIDRAVVAEYADAMHNGAVFPPVSVFFDGTEYWLADGFHRLFAAAEAGLSEIEAEVRPGTRRDAILHAAGANATHGLRRTNEDKRRAVTLLLNDEDWRQWSDREIARRCGVSNNFVGELRRSLSSDDSGERVYTTRHGTIATMNTANIGHDAPPDRLTHKLAALKERATARLTAHRADRERSPFWGTSLYETLDGYMNMQLAVIEHLQREDAEFQAIDREHEGGQIDTAQAIQRLAPLADPEWKLQNASVELRLRLERMLGQLIQE